MKKLFALAVAAVFVFAATALIAQEKKAETGKATVKEEIKVKGAEGTVNIKAKETEKITASGKVEEKVTVKEVAKWDEAKAKTDCQKAGKVGKDLDDCVAKKKGEALAVKEKTETTAAKPFEKKEDVKKAEPTKTVEKKVEEKKVK